MGYYIRVLSTSTKPVAISTIRAALAREGLRASLETEQDETDWSEISLSHESGEDIAQIERNVVEPGSLAEGEIEEFCEEIEDCRPASAAAWLHSYLSKVRCIYAFQLLRGTDVKNGWDIVGEVKNTIWRQAPSIIQADSEGFTNEDGYHILWQFSSDVKGTWWMGVLKDGKWIHFQMDLGDKDHREDFWRGDVPPGVRMA